MKVANLGAIKEIDLAECWQETTPRHEYMQRPTNAQFQMATSTLHIIDTCRPLSIAATQALIEAIKYEQNALAADEVAQLAEALGDLANPEYCRLDRVSTRRINGRIVLAFDATWLPSEQQVNGILTLQNDRSVQQIFVMHKTSATTIDSILRTIVWN